MSNITNDTSSILIIDDEPGVRNVLSELLSDTYNCKAVGSAEEALSLLSTARFDLVLSDINLSGMSGLEMIPHVLKISPDSVVVMISGDQTIESAIEAMRVGAFDYVRKPFDLLHVEAAVRRALIHRSLLDAKRQYEDHLEELVAQRTAELNHLSYHDVLTDLPNRLLFEDRLEQALVSAQHSLTKLCTIFLSVDDFKKVSDTLGHDLGRQLLKQIAERLVRRVREGETLARLEGDEFAILLTQVAGVADVVEAINHLRETLRFPFNVDGNELFVTVSLGIGLFPDDGQDALTLLKNASAALHRAREHGGNNYQFYTADLNTEALRRLSLENSLRRAIERNEFELLYQPQIDTRKKEIIGVEALVRWRHPERGMISPAEFIPVAEDTGLIVPIGEWVLRAACAQNESWHKRGFAPMRVAVNISARQLQQRKLAHTVKEILENTGMKPDSLELELTESSVMRNPDLSVKTLGELMSMGVKISIDDFGTGYSSLGYLKHLPIDILKIDKTFVRDVTTDPDDAALVMAIITLAHNLGLKVIAEGVETEEQLRFLHLLRCDQWQGYLFSRPLPADELEDLLVEKRFESKRADSSSLIS